jgi:hypothetical protein
MKRHAGVAIALVGLVLPIGLVVAFTARDQVPQGPVYSVAQLQASLADHPQAWVGRTVWVRGLAEGCLAARGAPPLLSCSRWPAYLVDAGEVGIGGTLPLAWGSQDGVLSFVRNVLQVGGLLRPAPTPQWWTLDTYRVRLSRTVCAIAPCYEAMLLDAAPGSL